MIKDIIVLHGWALIVNSGWAPFIKELRGRGYRVYFPKIPGLTGPSLKSVWNLERYSKWLAEYVKLNKINNFILIGHSFGGSLAIKYSASLPAGLAGLVLMDSSGIRPPRLHLKAIRVLVKAVKPFFVIYPLCLIYDNVKKVFYRLIGSHDYPKTHGFLAPTFQNLVNEDLTGSLKQVACPTLLLWGEKDTDTPLADGELMNRLIPSSDLAVFANASHGLPFQKRKMVITKIDQFVTRLNYAN